MKARVFKILKNNDFRIKCTYVDAAKFHDDIESCHHFYFLTPMMEIRLFKDNDTLEKDKLIVFASPEVIKEFTGFDMFNVDYLYTIDGHVIDIEFEWADEKNPYLKADHRKDRIITDRYKFPRIIKIEKADLDI